MQARGHSQLMQERIEDKLRSTFHSLAGKRLLIDLPLPFIRERRYTLKRYTIISSIDLDAKWIQKLKTLNPLMSACYTVYFKKKGVELIVQDKHNYIRRIKKIENWILYQIILPRRLKSVSNFVRLKETYEKNDRTNYFQLLPPNLYEQFMKLIDPLK